MSIASLITEKNKSNNLIIFDDFGKKIEKTKEMFKILKKFDANNSILIVDTKSKDKILFYKCNTKERTETGNL